ncbi:MAG: folylpolyglutamate synthase/dihydrofolate synthase family protein [Tissierellia bacterium]|nr:folylpolyglutamate synthase/dihydrofolate synthase family protein [Tissierellia bacterium]
MSNKIDFYKFLIDRGPSKGGHSLEKIKRLMEFFDNPQDKIKVIHIAGTNGKGSVANYIGNTLAIKHKVGLFTSPFMKKINESIKINGEDISDEDFTSIINRLKTPLEELDEKGLHNSYFEVLTAVMFIYFYEKKVDYAVVEVGLGGSLDSTNIIKSPLASIITTISKDHIQILGDSLEEIAKNKAGIIKKSCPVFLYPKEENLREIFYDKADEMNSEIFTFTTDEVKIKNTYNLVNQFSFRSYKDVKTRLLGNHQAFNASLALLFFDYFKNQLNLTKEDIYRGLFTASNPGRLEEISNNPRVIVDGSHNKEAIDALALALKSFEYSKLIICFSILEDKDYTYVIEKIKKLADEIVLTEIPNNPRALDLDYLYSLVKNDFSNVSKFKKIEDAYRYSINAVGENDLILWCGSLYLIGEILKIKERNNLG